MSSSLDTAIILEPSRFGKSERRVNSQPTTSIAPLTPEGSGLGSTPERGTSAPTSPLESATRSDIPVTGTTQLAQPSSFKPTKPKQQMAQPKQNPSTSSSDLGLPPKRKRGRPSKVEVERRRAEAEARGEQYPPPKRPKAKPGRKAKRSTSNCAITLENGSQPKYRIGFVSAPSSYSQETLLSPEMNSNGIFNSFHQTISMDSFTQGTSFDFFSQRAPLESFPQSTPFGPFESFPQTTLPDTWPTVRRLPGSSPGHPAFIQYEIAAEKVPQWWMQELAF
ncbi:hypothetical protein CC78DRAFT_575066 [Lojkania enalia]|uniref:Uncharacterized protein n=1 Tax=Lojkania enalia TaxID=147567 RepID=A0A9P4TQL0_9PLEO|nr:hypothetical protein CC78DRAFT_575066 [Didymosphaeria enalia]